MRGLKGWKGVLRAGGPPHLTFLMPVERHANAGR